MSHPNQSHGGTEKALWSTSPSGLCTHWVVRIVVDSAAIPLPSPRGWHLTTGEPLYIVNKANLGDMDRRRGSDRWKEVLAFEAAIRIAAARAIRDIGLDGWPRHARGFHVDVLMEFGDRIILVDGRKANAIRRRKGLPATLRTPHKRRDKARTRCDAYGVDSVKAILDALEGVVYDADEQATSQSSRKSAREGELVGDRITITIRLNDWPNGLD